MILLIAKKKMRRLRILLALIILFVAVKLALMKFYPIPKAMKLKENI